MMFKVLCSRKDNENGIKMKTNNSNNMGSNDSDSVSYSIQNLDSKILTLKPLLGGI